MSASNARNDFSFAADRKLRRRRHGVVVQKLFKLDGCAHAMFSIPSADEIAQPGRGLLSLHAKRQGLARAVLRVRRRQEGRGSVRSPLSRLYSDYRGLLTFDERVAADES